MSKLFGQAWGDFTLRHSRFYARRAGLEISRLAVADKEAVLLTPWWIYATLGRLTGETHEYMHHGRTLGTGLSVSEWCSKMHGVVRQYVKQHKDTADTLGLFSQIRS